MLSVTNKLLVAVVDLGTDDSGYGYSLRSDYEKDPMKVRIRTWNSGCFLSAKQPTCVLCDPAGQFNSFGYEAENKYTELSEEKAHYNWYFLRKFLNMISDKQVNIEFALTDEKGLKMPAVEVFSMAIRYYKECLLDDLKSQGVHVTQNEIHWVFPVPAIWTVSAIYLLREAANRAGIDGATLTIALAPHAAAVYCQFFPSERTSCGGRFDDDKYMIIDLGDSTAVFTFHEKHPDGTIKDVHNVSSGPWGSTNVNEEFTQMITNIFGERTFKTFRDDNPEDLVEMFREMELKINKISIDDNQTFLMRVPFALEETYQKITGETVQDTIQQSRYKGKIQLKAGKLRLDAELFRSFFKKCISNITNHIEHLCQEPGVKGTSTFLMIGKFSECRLVQKSVIKAFPKCKVVIPDEPNEAVIKGAVVLGHEFGVTYGYNHRLQQSVNKDHITISASLVKRDEVDVSSVSFASGATCSSSYERKYQIRYQSLRDDREDALSSDLLELSIQTQDEITQGQETQLKNQMTLEADSTRAPSDDELFDLSRQLNKHDKEWWLLAKLLGLSDKQIDEIEQTKGDTHIVRQYYKMLTVWKSQNAGQEKGSVRYLLSKCDEAGIDRNVTDNVFGN